MGFFAGLVFFRLLSFKSVSVSSRIVCFDTICVLTYKSVFRGFGVDEMWIFAETHTVIYLCGLGQVNHGSLYESCRSSFIVSDFDRRSGILVLLLFLFFVTNAS